MAYTDRVDMPFIVLSANATADAMRRCEEAQIDAYLTKPVEPARLLQALDSVLDSRRPSPPGISGSSSTVAELTPPVPNSGRPTRTIDRAKLTSLQRLNAAPEFVQGLIHSFLVDNAPKVARMRAALDAGRTEEFREIAEQLRTASAAVGRGVCKAVARRPERCGSAIFRTGLESRWRLWRTSSRRLNRNSNLI